MHSCIQVHGLISSQPPSPNHSLGFNSLFILGLRPSEGTPEDRSATTDYPVAALLLDLPAGARVVAAVRRLLWDGMGAERPQERLDGSRGERTVAANWKTFSSAAPRRAALSTHRSRGVCKPGPEIRLRFCLTGSTALPPPP